MTIRLFAFGLVCLKLAAQSYSLPQLPRITSPSNSPLFLVWDATNAYSITPSNLGNLVAANKLNTTNGTANGLTVIGALTTTGSSGPLYNDPATSKIGFGGVASAPMDFWVNLVKVGANDGASTIRARSNGTDKDLNLIAPDRAGNEAGFMRYSLGSSANTLKIGGASSGYRLATTVNFAAGSSISDTTGATVFSYNSSGITASQLFTANAGITSAGATITGSIDTTGSSGPLYVNPSASKIGFGGIASQPFEFYANIMRFGANDGSTTNRLRTANTGQDISFTAPDYAAATAVGFLRMSPTLAANTMQVGAGPGGYKAATSVRFYTASTATSTSPTARGNINSSGQWVIGGLTPTGSSALTVTSTTGGITPPSNSTATWNGFTMSQGEFGFDTTVNKLILWDGSARRYLATTTDLASYQPLNADLSAIAASGTGAAGRAVLALSTASSILSYLGGQPASSVLTNVANQTAQSLPSTIISVTENTQTGTTYTVQSTDNGKVVTLNNASAITVTVPTLSAGFSCTFIQKGAGQVTFSASGTTINNAHSQTKTYGQYSAVTLYGLSSTSFVLAGDTGS